MGMGSIGSRDFRVAGIALACVVVPASAIAASADYFLKLEGVDGESKDDKHKGEIEIQSFSWGATQREGSGQADALTDGLLILRNTAPPASGAAGGGGGGGMDAAKAGGTGMGKGKASMSDLSVMRGPRQTTSLDGVQGATGAEKFGAISGAHRDDSVAGRADAALAAPLARGSVRIKVKFPWLDCRVGAAFPNAVLHNDAGRYELKDVIITSCSSGGDRPMESLSLNYTKVIVRGWDPEKKEK